MQILQLSMVFLGGGLGSCSRYFVSQVITRELQAKTAFPLGTFTVNIVGCLIIGVVIGLIERFQLSPNWVLFLATGFCGGFTTFSSFAFENNLLLRNNEYLVGLAYTSISLFWGIAATFLGNFLMRKL